MPLYHIAGISVNFLASLTAGATVLFFSGQFDVCRFVAEVERDEHRPTWCLEVMVWPPAWQVLRGAGGARGGAEARLRTRRHLVGARNV